MWTGKTFALLAVLGLGGLGQADQAVQVDARLPAYKRTSAPLAGEYKVVGAVALKKAMEIWTEAFSKLYPNVKFQLDLKGSSTAAAPLVTGLSQIAPMGRELWDMELVQFKHTWGYLPLRVRVSSGSYNVSQRSQILVIYVNKDNPIEKLTLAQVDAIFSRSRKRGYKEEINTWSQLGVPGDWAKQPIHLYGLTDDSTGVAEWFRNRVLLKGRFRDTTIDLSGPQELMTHLAADRSGIGFTGISYLNPTVRIVPLAETDKGPYSTGSLGDVLAGKYPLTRQMYVYLKKEPGKPLDPVIQEFLLFILSKDGQQVQVKSGELLPLPFDDVEQERAELSKLK